MRSKPSEIGGIADEDAMMLGEIGFEVGSSMEMNGAEEEIGLGIGTVNPCTGRETGTEA